jgi:hypothetical protein
MKEEIFKVSYEAYTTVVFHDTVPITFPTLQGTNIFSRTKMRRIFGTNYFMQMIE